MIRFDSLPPEVMESLCTPMHEIIASQERSTKQTGALWLGSLAAATDQDLLREHHIVDLVQVLDVPWLPQTDEKSFRTYRIDIMDTASADLKSHLEGVCQHIDDALKAGRNVLVHCHQVCLAPSHLNMR